MLFLLLTFVFKSKRLPVWVSSGVLALEISTLNVVIAIHGAATNPFSSILLVPLVLGLMLLPFRAGVGLLLLSILAQLTQLVFLDTHIHGHGDMMLTHARDMIVGFVITCFLIASVVFYLRLRLMQQQDAIQNLRERQLRDEQLLAIGTAAAQLTHDTASPIQTMRLLIEEAREDNSADVVDILDEQLTRVEVMLSEWRGVADDVREFRQTCYQGRALFKSLRNSIALARPEVPVSWHLDEQAPDTVVMADRTLLPALTNILVNACEASIRCEREGIQVDFLLTASQWQLTIRNAICNDDASRLNELGRKLVASKDGMGLGAIVSNASIEKFGGSVVWQSENNLAMTKILLPVTEKYAENHTY
ncbi:GHKL domain-containing protein [Aestuariibacter sp. AA17]|uniref:GHKL domain-containing protein n=1 Tax=Fluctibacter corallii TaxID=2984329 RepID=A0ABT3ACE9_9ALTE|nr:GHKL domain-containing protein [Aestuariibacter sp. AA17]MCV2886356.1 GHKL domain-containing protein [Aestuariibacter sp. AA17]